MKFNPTLPLALALSVGAAGAVMAQTATNQTPATTPPTGYSQPATPYGQPQANAAQPNAQTPSTANQMQAPTGQTPSTAAQTQQPRPTAAASTMASGGNEQVRMAQQRLHAAGLYNGPEDGIMDPDTRAAIARYQEQHGLQRSESLDPATLADLEGGQTTGYGATTPPAPTPSPGAPSAAANPSAGAMGGNAGKSTAR